MRGASGGGAKILAAVGAAAAVGYLLALDVAREDVRVVTKALPMLCLLAWQWPPEGRYGRWIFSGLALSLLGDVLLDMGPGLFLPGLGAFLLAHVSYAVAYVSATRRPCWGRALPFGLLAVGASVLLGPYLGDMTLPVIAYVLVICTMTWRASAMLGSAALGRRAQTFALVGALMFAVSDGVLAIRLFVSPLPGSNYAVMLLYWSAQLCIAASVHAAATVDRTASQSAALQRS
ncbi:lysoplasmalogenase [Comamonas sp. JC664]|uniref:lysoplasmalogenase n=1 Tax=Comamonas sp. JC664 TaxID=2801917 RepID=UPI00191F0CF8|nr:lysoplasmalogenase [Comamonas sp. JC664]MBL0697959.1 lysoplasmalogenase [Comamonas sp. JC664]GHG70563.1 membrane protein [Comamonas sp. KCTC 72670]